MKNPYDLSDTRQIESACYRLGGSFIFLEGTEPVRINGGWDCDEENYLIAVDSSDEIVRVHQDDLDNAFIGVPTLGWYKYRGAIEYAERHFPETKYKWGLELGRDCPSNIGWQRLRTLMRNRKDEQGFLSGNGVLTPEIAARDGLLHYHNKTVGVVKDAVVYVKPEYDFVSFDLFKEGVSFSVGEPV